MPGAWEVNRLGSVLVGILHTDNVTIAWSCGFRNLQIPGAVMPVAGMPYDMARNVVCMKALDIGADFVFFLDSDVVPPNDAILRLMSRNLPIVSGIYCRRSPPAAVPVMMRNHQWVTEYPANSLIEVDVVGAGCLLIRRDVLLGMKAIDPERGRHWFSWRVDMGPLLPAGEAMSEDYSFCLHARRSMGLKIMVDTSIMCRHVGLAQSTYGKFEPCEVHP